MAQSSLLPPISGIRASPTRTRMLSIILSGTMIRPNGRCMNKCWHFSNGLLLDIGLSHYTCLLYPTLVRQSVRLTGPTLNLVRCVFKDMSMNAILTQGHTLDHCTNVDANFKLQGCVQSQSDEKNQGYDKHPCGRLNIVLSLAAPLDLPQKPNYSDASHTSIPLPRNPSSHFMSVVRLCCKS